MPALLLQAAAAASNSSGLAAQAAQIKANCHAQHGDTPSLVSCPECYGALLDALRTRYFGTISPSSSSLPPTTTTGGTTTSDDPSQPSNPETEQPPQQQQQQQQPPQPEWFSSRPAFLADLDALLDAAKTYQVPPQAVDDRVRAERAAWYAERVRGSLLRLLVADEDEGGMAALRRVVFERLEDSSVTAVPVAAEGGGLAPAATGASAGIQDGDDGGGDPAALARVVAEMLAQGGLRAAGAADLQRKLAAAAAAGKNRTARDVELLRDAFFTAEDGVTVPENHQRYLDMLQHEGLSMEQVVDRILEERQAAAGAKEQADKLRQRLDELRRARAAHEALKSRKAERRESLAQQKVPDELYELPACDSCGRATSPSEYFCCDICTVLATAGALPQQTVYCSVECEEKGEISHAEAHRCASGSRCIQQPQQVDPAIAAAGDGEDTQMEEAPPLFNDLRLCVECTSSLKQPTIWCSLACADANFEAHREEVHLPERKKLGLDHVDDEDQLEYYTDEKDGSRRYRVKDLGVLMVPLNEAVREWEARNHVKLEAPLEG